MARCDKDEFDYLVGHRLDYDWVRRANASQGYARWDPNVIYPDLENKFRHENLIPEERAVEALSYWNIDSSASYNELCSIVNYNSEWSTPTTKQQIIRTLRASAVAVGLSYTGEQWLVVRTGPPSSFTRTSRKERTHVRAKSDDPSLDSLVALLESLPWKRTKHMMGLEDREAITDALVAFWAKLERVVAKHEVKCRSNKSCEEFLQIGGNYAQIDDPDQERVGFLRVIDGSGREVIYPNDLFTVHWKEAVARLEMLKEFNKTL